MAGDRLTKISIFTKRGGSTTALWEYVATTYFTVLVTGAAFVVEHLIGYRTIALLYLLLVVVLGIKFRRGPVLLAAAASALAWDFFFIPTRFSLHIAGIEDLTMFGMFFVVAMAMGHLTSQLHSSEMVERRRQQRFAALYELVQQAGLAPDLDSGLHAAIRLTESLFGVRAALFLRCADQTLAKKAHPPSPFALSEKELKVAAWAFHHRMPAGKCTDNRPEAETVHLPLQVGAEALGVLSIDPLAGSVLGPAEIELLKTFAMLIGAILERDHLLQGVKRAEILNASERLQRALLQSVSHELKTPLSAIQAGVDALTKDRGKEERSRTILREIQQALRRLNRIINNLLDMSRIESGVVQPKLDWCDVSEIIEAAKDIAADVVGRREIEVDLDRNLPLVRTDQSLLEQCLSNLLLNAASNSGIGNLIKMTARVVDDRLVITVQDEGKGIAESELPRIFEAFYRGTDSRPGGTGLGLAIVDGFIRALGGSVTAANIEPSGVEFVIVLPVETLQPDVMENLA